MYSDSKLTITPCHIRAAVHKRHSVIYAHKLYPGSGYVGQDIDRFGFARGQVSEFNVSTPDGETLLAWHVLPLNVYADHRDDLDDARTSAPISGLDLLRNDKKNARVVIYFHGVSGHISEGWRTYAYRYFSDLDNVHVMALDYRGYGPSTGEPSEPGLIVDGVAFLDYIMHDLGIPPENIIVQGQSLGTAVASAVALHYADPTSELLPPYTRQVLSKTPRKDAVVFANILLVAPFASFPDLLLTYKVKGSIPLLRPLRNFPNIQDLLRRHIPDSWESAKRLQAYYKALSGQPGLLDKQKTSISAGGITLIHAANDPEIPVIQTAMIVERITGERPDVHSSVGKVADIRQPRAPVVTVEIIKHGGKLASINTAVHSESKTTAGHSRIVTSAQIMLAIKGIFKQNKP